MKYLIYRLLWRIAPLFKYGLPVHLDIELNNNCNQKCLSCWHSEKKLPFKIKNIDIDTLYRRLQEGHKIGFKSVKFNLRGEPLISFNLFSAIREAKRLGYVDIMINTNGVYLKKDVVFNLEKAGLTTCIISVDSFDRNTYCTIHNCGYKDYDDLMLNLHDIFYLKSIGECNINFNLNMHKNIYNEKEYESNVNNILFLHLTPVFRNTMNRHGVNLSVVNKDRKRKKYCPHMIKRLTILSNGKVYPCCVCYDEPEDIKLSDGIENLENIWNGRRRDLINNYKKGKYSESCLKCTSEDIYK